LDTKINKENSLTEEVRSRLAAANRKYFSLQKHFKSRYVSIATEIQLYKTEVRPVAMYGVECWTLSRTNERVFERKILRRIYGPIRNKGQLRSRHNKELYDLFKESKLSITIRIARLRWAGHVRRMDEEALPRRIMYVTPIGQRETGRRKARWREEVGKDARMLVIRCWWSTAMNREEWR
jgi:hypothetical protein